MNRLTGRWPAGQVALRATMVLAPVLALQAGALAGTPPRLWLTLLVAALGLAWTRLPDAAFGTVALGVVVLWWAAGPGRHAPGPALLLAAALLVAAHVAGLLAAYGPSTLGVDRGLLRLWVGRAALALLLAPVALGVTLLAAPGRGGPGVWMAGLAVAFLALSLAGAAFAADESEPR
ncbi:MAG: hypothetical protein ACXVWZ_10255 [Nocardioides sp.]